MTPRRWSTSGTWGGQWGTSTGALGAVADCPEVRISSHNQSLLCILTLFWTVLLTCSECGCIKSINMQDQSLINTRPGSSSQLPAPGPELMGSAVRDAAKRRMAAVEWIKSHPCHVISPAIKILPLWALNKKVGHPVILYKMSGIVWREQWPPCTLVTAQLSQLLWPDLTFGSNNGCGPKLNTHSY